MKTFKTILYTFFIAVILTLSTIYFINKNKQPQLRYVTVNTQTVKQKIVYKPKYIYKDSVSVIQTIKTDTMLVQPKLQIVQFSQSFEDSLGNKLNVKVNYNEATNTGLITPTMMFNKYITTYTTTIQNNKTDTINLLLSTKYITFKTLDIYSVGGGIRLYQKIDLIGSVQIYNDTSNKQMMLGVGINITYKF